MSALLVEAGRGTSASVPGVVLAALAAALLVVIVAMAAPSITREGMVHLALVGHYEHTVTAKLVNGNTTFG